ncbi:CLUMA_CG021462, isoform A [Clunio marinus]|uniref:CLUMA_CG021462, isoform A n=1 Tax=Clunio marinus TaxID=568069 RepID=A0A1J1JBK9_9DIPT|nr:CLUMA_CG021462, isoform A [Clunio marinus]
MMKRILENSKRRLMLLCTIFMRYWEVNDLTFPVEFPSDFPRTSLHFILLNYMGKYYKNNIFTVIQYQQPIISSTSTTC